jgi:hypothetical protein
MEEIVARSGLYGSKKVTTVNVPYIAKFDTIEVLTAATFTYLQEDGYDGIGAGVAQVDTVTLTGTSGTANISAAGGLTKLATWNTSLTQTAADFVTAHAAAYALVGITVTSSVADIIFTSTLVGMPFAHPVITNVTTNLDGTVANTTPNTTTPLSEHGIYAATTAGDKIFAKTKFSMLQISAGVVVVY